SVFAPMVQICWGEADLLQADIGILIEHPEPVRAFIIGSIRSTLPDADDPIVEVNLDVLGVPDFAKKSLAIDATLCGSHIWHYPLTGDGALRLTLGDHPQFAFSLGGFHPRFAPPPDFPSLQRLALEISCGS